MRVRSNKDFVQSGAVRIKSMTSGGALYYWPRGHKRKEKGSHDYWLQNRIVQSSASNNQRKRIFLPLIRRAVAEPSQDGGTGAAKSQRIRGEPPPALVWASTGHDVRSLETPRRAPVVELRVDQRRRCHDWGLGARGTDGHRKGKTTPPPPLLGERDREEVPV